MGLCGERVRVTTCTRRQFDQWESIPNRIRRVQMDLVACISRLGNVHYDILLSSIILDWTCSSVQGAHVCAKRQTVSVETGGWGAPKCGLCGFGFIKMQVRSQRLSAHKDWADCLTRSPSLETKCSKYWFVECRLQHLGEFQEPRAFKRLTSRALRNYAGRFKKTQTVAYSAQ